ncbi:MotA/TolQ/ExbB proton channel family protein [Parasulfuritortus cantonensis]|uniref:MotA/TolQ/ExbB proton channel family protein n=1 Tax=Parasulfuritortus cantonensis TaxID=2528202 RepID=UPI0023EA6CDF|nr:MotA/TolQ/ExbB proton channel family protein [Parasulfuritortus cantonensis]
MTDSLPQPGFAHFLSQADAMAQFVLLVLLVMSVASWYVILVRLLRGWRRGRRSRAFLAGFRAAPAAGPAEEPYGRLAAAAFRAWGRHAGGGQAGEWLARALRRGLLDEAARLESGLAVLASVAASAPFVGLFGTVWGIYHALLAIGVTGRAGLEQVAGPVGEALVMTAIGLSVAIPAVLAYNAFQRGNRVLQAELDGFAHDLYDHLAGGSPAGEAR